MAETHEHFRELLRCVRQGHEDAAWQLVHQYGDAIRRAVRRVLNERLRSQFDSLDFVQLVWKSFFRVRDAAERFQSPGELAAYLLAMARNKVGMEVRRRLLTEKYNVNRERPLNAPQGVGAQGLPDPGPGPMDVAIARERWERLVQHQPPHYRQIIQLRLQGYTCREIGGSLHLAECTVRRFLKRLLHETTV